MEARSFQQAVRTAPPTYPIPFAFAVSLLFAAFCFSLSTRVEGGLRWLLAGTAAFATVGASGLLGYAARYKNELLRSERHVLLMEISGIIGDSEMDPAARERVSRALLEAAETRLRKAAVRDSGEHDDAEGDQ